MIAWEIEMKKKKKETWRKAKIFKENVFKRESGGWRRKYQGS